MNVEYCNSDKSIKNICNYVNKGSDRTVLDMQPERNDKNAVIHINEMAQYLAGKHMSNYEAVLRILSFPIHGRSPVFVRLAVYIKNR